MGGSAAPSTLPIHAGMPVRSRTTVAIAVLAWLGLMGAAAGFLAASQANARHQLDERLQARAESGAKFSSLYVTDIFARERGQAAAWLTGRATPQSLERAAGAVGFAASVLLDRDGRVLQAAPSKPGLVGQVITGSYAHLAAAVAGRAAVSNVVPSAARGVPVVGLAVPFATASGRRVFSGAFDVSKTPLGAYMNHMTVIPGRRVYLVDATGSVIANSGPGLRGRTTLGQVDPPLAAQLAARSTGRIESPQGSRFFVSAAVSGTPWRLALAVPESQLYISINGSSQWLAWLALTGLAIAGLLIILLGFRLLRSRRRLGRLNGELDRLGTRGLPHRPEKPPRHRGEAARGAQLSPAPSIESCRAADRHRPFQDRERPAGSSGRRRGPLGHRAEDRIDAPCRGFARDAGEARSSSPCFPTPTPAAP